MDTFNVSFQSFTPFALVVTLGTFVELDVLMHGLDVLIQLAHSDKPFATSVTNMGLSLLMHCHDVMLELCFTFQYCATLITSLLWLRYFGVLLSWSS